MTKYVSLLLFVFSFFAHTGKAYSQDSSNLRISLLTCTPGDELYSIFGHSAIRIVDSSSVTDIVYNYGTFNFDDEGFYVKFIRGKLPYYLSIENFEDFKWLYQATNRGITEQVLALSPQQKIYFQHLLNENLKEENKYYQYDFFLDNCTTRLRDAIVKIKTPTPVLPPVMPVNTTFRNAIHKYLNAGGQYWSKLGIDLLLGAPTDGIMTVSQQQFLPDNLMHALDSSTNTTVVAAKTNLYEFHPERNSTWFTPLFFFSALLILFIMLEISQTNFTRQVLKGADALLLLFTGLIGILLIFMCTATDHSMTKNNFNLLWAWPSHFIAAFFYNSKSAVLKSYLWVSVTGLSLVLLSWFFLPQQLNVAFIPFVLLLIYRMATRIVNFK